MAPMFTVVGGTILRAAPPHELEVVVEEEEGDVMGFRVPEPTRVLMTLRSPPYRRPAPSEALPTEDRVGPDPVGLMCAPVDAVVSLLSGESNEMDFIRRLRRGPRLR